MHYLYNYIHDFIYGLRNISFYFTTIWKDRAWDYYYIAKLFDKKMEQLERHYTHKYCCAPALAGEDQEKVIKKIKEIRGLLHIYLEDDEDIDNETEYLKEAIKLLLENVELFWD